MGTAARIKALPTHLPFMLTASSSQSSVPSESWSFSRLVCRARLLGLCDIYGKGIVLGVEDLCAVDRLSDISTLCSA